MSKMIRHVSELPEWFDIRPYEMWEDKKPHEAAMAVSDRFFFWWVAASMMYKEEGAKYMASEEEIEAALNSLAESAKKPFHRLYMKPIMEIFRVQRHLYNEKDVAEELDEADREEEQISDQVEQAAKGILGDDFCPRIRAGVNRVTLWDAMDFMKRNQELIRRVEESAQSLADRYGWDFEEVRDAMFEHIPMHGDDGSSFIIIEGHPTIDAQVQEIRRYLIKNYGDEGSMPKARPSEVRKLFDYRAAAYADLKIWACLTESSITAKCMAQALFPDGRFSELDMRPSRTVGGFFKRLEGDRFYLDDITSKAAEMDSMQK
ncbi:hypothetical protein ACGTN6_00910 [Halomonas sp. THAF12]|uniref:hypothetical protein n=1 Tax=Halomonas sp. B23F22_10 TaxID=3459515 RepID=UPI00373F6EB6